MEEKWKFIPGYDGYYKASTLGQIKSIERIDCRGQKRKSMILKQRTDKDGYKVLSLSKKGKNRLYLVHRLIAITFIDNPNNKPQINHINEDKTDNRTENLEWCTPKENTNHGTAIERRKRPKAVVAIEINTGTEIEFSSVKETKEFGFNRSQVSNCCNHVKGYYTHRGYKFKWKEVRIR